MLPFLRPFCKHKRERLVYIRDDAKIYYCPDCHKYKRDGYITRHWSKRLGDITDFIYVGEEK